MKQLDPKYLTDNDLWDTEWLEEKYPERFEKRNNKYYKGNDNKFYRKD